MEAHPPTSTMSPDLEMYERSKMQAFFAMRPGKPRPMSEATEIFDTDFEDDSSEFEEDADPQSPKFSLQSRDSRKSQTTISSYDEVLTPQSTGHFQFLSQPQTHETKPVDGPKGPHLFRSSLSSTEFSYAHALQMSPLVSRRASPGPETSLRAQTAFRHESAPVPFQPAYDHCHSDHDGNEDDLDYRQGRVDDAADVSFWSAQAVAAWMGSLGFEDAITDKFEEHDITGVVLLDMQFEDLKELGISSFGKRHQLWNHIDALRANDGRVSPAHTPFEDTSRPATVNRRRRGRKQRHGEDDITPGESVSIVAIEQLLPRPHNCARGERCQKWRKQQRLYQRLQQEHGFPISPEHGGHIFMAGNPGNARAAQRVVQNVYRPTSDAMASVVASSALLGPGQTPVVVQPTEESLRNVELRDPQENVKHFLNFQGVDPPHMQRYTPEAERSESPLEMFPPLQPPHQTQPAHSNLRDLPRLQIPRSSSAQPSYASQQVHRPEMVDAFSPCRDASASPGLYRFGTPASEMDVPVTHVSLGPVSRDVSQSVPPSMQYRDPVQRSSNLSRAADWQRPSFGLPPVHEGEVLSPSSDPAPSTARRQSGSPVKSSAVASSTANPVKHDRLTRFGAPQKTEASRHQHEAASHAGWMKKRRTRLLRHEWQDQHFRLTGTQLAMHSSDAPDAVALDTIDVDEYAVACSSIASNKLAAKLRGLKFAKKDGQGSGPLDAAFTFQLVPTGLVDAEKRAVKKAAAHGKTHHFAVKTRDDRIDWMRELMLAKALKAKSEGYQVEVNGSAI